MPRRKTLNQPDLQGDSSSVVAGHIRFNLLFKMLVKNDLIRFNTGYNIV